MKLSKAGLTRVLIVASWAGMMAWFVRYEAYPQHFTNTLEGYRDVLSEGQLFMDSWMKILFRGSPIGISHTSIQIDDSDPLSHYRISNRTLLSLNVMGEAQQISANSSGSLDVLYRLHHFDFTLAARRYSMRIDGTRHDGNTFVVHVKSDMGQRSLSLEIPDDVIIYSPLMEMSMSRLKPGEHLRVRTLDPASMTVGDVIVKALGREDIEVSGTNRNALALSVAYQGVELKTWIDEDGRVLRQDTPLGWTMETCTTEEAMTLRFEENTAEDMLRATAVPCDGVIEAPEKLALLRLRLTGATLEGMPIESVRQDVVSITGAVAEVAIRPASWPEDGAAPGAAPFEADLGATPFIQSDHPDVIQRAQAIVASANAVTPRDKARAIGDWVFRKVKKEPTVSLPSTLDVLKRMEGDCNEHTYLFVGLARAAGLPAKVRVGLLYKEGVFYYHAWPSVFVGAWVEMDPTLGQELADASHIGLLDGELGNQLKLFGLFGRLRAEVLEQRYGGDS